MDTDSLGTPQKALLAARDAAGGLSALARICKCTPSNIFQLIAKGSPLPPRFVLAVEAKTGVSRHDLRPDIYPLESSGMGPGVAPAVAPPPAAGVPSHEGAHS
jgi:DNA-binding transcriptional regulator YdaS (Cro superfamily)